MKILAEESMRLFVGIPLPDCIKLALRGAGLPAPKNAHLTLRFIGDALNAGLLAEALGHIHAPAMLLRIIEARMFKRNIMAAQIEPSRELEFLKTEMDAALAAIGLKPERRRFRPHITLSRRGQLADGPRALAIEWRATFFCLFQSFLGPAGAEHVQLGRFELEA